ncbi:class E basic helix-loop-helix protein 40-like [Branchiostoma floridae]|uniref:Class E basic helix-loop-helix protein 40-like n=1 Tax=Branchiostoma floridae TaxID=7739 RepID=A0A9J7HVJ6_BRAFL|nr:class E basic helix-loop-helix protein 40-like [Branchiostoma floridae]
MNVEVSTTGGASDPALALRLNMQRDNEAYPLPPHKRVKTENMSYDLHGSISPVHMAFMTDSRGFRRRNMQGTEEQRDLHRIVEKRRRDRINDCLANIRELLPEELVRQKVSCSFPMSFAVSQNYTSVT